MIRKIFAGILIVLSSVLLILNVLGIGLAWIYNEPLTQTSIVRLKEIDGELARIQTDLQSAGQEVERALRIIEASEKALASLAQGTYDIKQFLDEVNKSLDEELIPGLIKTRERINQVRGTLEDLRIALEQINALPLLDLNLPGDEVLAGIIAEFDSLDAEMTDAQDLAQRASTFISDTSYMLGGDLNETKQNLQELQQTLKDYDQKVTDWRSQVRLLFESVSHWIDNASIILTLFLIWFGVSQFSLILHGLSIRRGDDPLAILR